MDIKEFQTSIASRLAYLARELFVYGYVIQCCEVGDYSMCGGSTIELITDVGIARRGADLSWSAGRY